MELPAALPDLIVAQNIVKRDALFGHINNNSFNSVSRLARAALNDDGSYAPLWFANDANVGNHALAKAKAAEIILQAPFAPIHFTYPGDETQAAAQASIKFVAVSKFDDQPCAANCFSSNARTSLTADVLTAIGKVEFYLIGPALNLIRTVSFLPIYEPQPSCGVHQCTATTAWINTQSASVVYKREKSYRKSYIHLT